MVISGTIKTKAVATRYPVVSGTTAETTKTAGRIINIVPTNGSMIARSKKQGL